jgi:peptidoglycan/LPS O-acetylase OafA/YrhL
MITGHRSDLDGLRTVAVYLVLMFHAGLSWFAGGYVGVDMFFCLSGFLVTSVLMTELQTTGSLRVGRFYSRRVRRLLPAAVVVVIATCLTFMLLWSVVRRASIVGDAVSALLYYANFHFLSATGDYFATDIDKSPFLHFWSLSIEEQFYAFFPVLLLLLYRFGRSRRRYVVLGGLGFLMVVSLADQIWFASRNVDRAYYGTDTRLYQLLAGALLTGVFAFTSRRMRRGHAHLLAVAGIVGVVVVATGVVDLSPSWRGIGATAGSILLLGGLAQAEGSPLSRLLALKPMAYLGRISYGTYLWHWPVIVALKTVLDAGPLPIALLAFAIASGLAALSAELLELPIRRTPRLDPVTWPVVVAGLAASAWSPRPSSRTSWSGTASRSCSRRPPTVATSASTPSSPASSTVRSRTSTSARSSPSTARGSTAPPRTSPSAGPYAGRVRPCCSWATARRRCSSRSSRSWPRSTASPST